MKKWIVFFVLEFLALIIFADMGSIVLISFIWILLHECVHVFVSKRFGCRIDEVKINVWGANADIKDFDDLNEKEKCIIYAAGPVFNFCISAAFFCLFKIFNYKIMEDCFRINLALGIFNILPAYPLDGSRLLEIILSKKIHYKKVKKITEFLSYFTAVLLIAGFAALVFYKKENISLLITAILIIYITYREKEKAMFILMKDFTKKSTRLKKYKFMENKSVSVYYKTELIELFSLFDKNRFNNFYVLDDDLNVLGIIYEQEILEILKQNENITLEEYFRLKNSR